MEAETKTSEPTNYSKSKIFDEENNVIIPETFDDVCELVSESGEDDENKGKYFRQLFDHLGGNDMPLEALELCFGRNNLGLRDKQMRLLAMFTSVLDRGNNEDIEIYTEKRTIMQVMTQYSLANMVIRIMLIKPKHSNELITFTNNLYYHCLNMLQYLTDERYVDKKTDRVRTLVLLRKYDALSRLVEFLDPKIATPLTIFQASTILKQLANDHDDMGALLNKTSCLEKCLYLMARKQCEKMFVKYYNENYLDKTTFDKDEVDAIENFYLGKKHLLKRRERYPPLTKSDYRLECFMYMAFDVQTNCAILVYRILNATELLTRKDTLLSKPFCKTINKWLWTPCIWRPERTMLHLCFNVLRGAIEHTQYLISSQLLLRHYEIIELVEEQIFNADKDILMGVVSLLGVFLKQFPDCRKKVSANKIITKALTIYVHSYDEQVQLGALQTMCTLAHNRDTSAMVIEELGMTAEKMHLLQKYDNELLPALFKQLKSFLNQNCPKEWRQTNQVFRKVSYAKKYSLEKAWRYKEEGNEKFKEEDFEAALKCYTLGIDCLPPVENIGNEKSSRKTSWFILPSVLFSNRAQCYLTMKKWEETVADCTQAIVRSYEENEEANKMLYKTVYRRARAFVELKDYCSALNDVSFCLQQSLSATAVRSLFREVLTEYRKQYGIEPLRRCGACMDGLGTKLKRCAKCPEVYCSRECQAFAWAVEGHKNLCNYTLDG